MIQQSFIDMENMFELLDEGHEVRRGCHMAMLWEIYVLIIANKKKIQISYFVFFLDHLFSCN